MATTEERAAETERRIREVVDGGRFVLGDGYQHTFYQREKWMQDEYKRPAMPGECGGCALGAIAFAVAGNVGQTVTDLRNLVEKDGVATWDDVLQLEMGYEGYPQMCGRYDVDVQADPSDPFHKLGKKLREVRTCLWNRPASESAPQPGNG